MKKSIVLIITIIAIGGTVIFTNTINKRMYSNNSLASVEPMYSVGITKVLKGE